jgi:hypothetical protein
LFLTFSQTKPVLLKVNLAMGSRGVKIENYCTYICRHGTEKLPLHVIGKPEKPRCFKNVRSLPRTCGYNSCLDQREKCFCLSANAPAHSKDVSSLNNIRVEFLPANTSVLQPMGQGIIRLFQHRYHKRLVYSTFNVLQTQKELT